MNAPLIVPGQATSETASPSLGTGSSSKLEGPLAPPWPGAALSVAATATLALTSVAAFHVGFLFPSLFPLGLVWLGGLFALRRVATDRRAFYLGATIGMGMYAPQLGFFWAVFGPAAAVLWLILALWIGLFLLLLHRCEARFGPRMTFWAAPALWLAVEYFRGELYPLRFSWFTAGSFLPLPELAPVLRVFGMYGAGALGMLIAAWVVRVFESGMLKVLRETRNGLAALALALALGRLGVEWNSYRAAQAGSVKVAGVQLEFPGLPEVLEALDRLVAAHPETELILLSEYTFDGPPPQGVLRWCRDNARWLVVGGKDPLPGNQFYNTAFVIGPTGEVAFQQAKNVPIQFFNDGLPAPQSRVWESPWGPLGIAICYDASYTRVIDRIVRQGARGLLLPAMDVTDWGAHQHRLNARITRIRAAEYGLPVFRVASSGLSQVTDAQGRLRATAGFPGQGEVVAGELAWPAMHAATLPLDRYLAWPALLGALALAAATFHRRKPRSTPGEAAAIPGACA